MRRSLSLLVEDTSRRGRLDQSASISRREAQRINGDMWVAASRTCDAGIRRRRRVRVVSFRGRGPAKPSPLGRHLGVPEYPRRAASVSRTTGCSTSAARDPRTRAALARVMHTASAWAAGSKWLSPATLRGYCGEFGAVRHYPAAKLASLTTSEGPKRLPLDPSATPAPGVQVSLSASLRLGGIAAGMGLLHEVVADAASKGSLRSDEYICEKRTAGDRQLEDHHRGIVKAAGQPTTRAMDAAIDRCALQRRPTRSGVKPLMDKRKPVASKGNESQGRSVCVPVSAAINSAR